eukprot:gene7223-16896_t
MPRSHEDEYQETKKGLQLLKSLVEDGTKLPKAFCPVCLTEHLPYVNDADEDKRLKATMV